MNGKLRGSVVVLAGLLASAPAYAAPGNKAEQALQLIVLVTLAAIALPCLLLGVLLGRSGVSLACAAVFPGVVRRGGEALRLRPWLCFGTGVFGGLLVLGLAAFFAKPAPPLTLLLLLGLGLAGAIGSSALAELLGERLFTLMPRREPSRLGALVLGSVVLPFVVLTPPGWVLAPVVAAVSLGAFKLGLSRRGIEYLTEEPVLGEPA